MPRGRFDPARFPWVPRMMQREMAAYYCGVSVDTFDYEVSEKLLPQPLPRGRKGGLPTWDRLALDDALDARAGRSQGSAQREHWLGQL